MSSPRSSIMAEAVLRHARHGVAALALCTLTGCAYSASASWSLGGDTGWSRARGRAEPDDAPLIAASRADRASTTLPSQQPTRRRVRSALPSQAASASQATRGSISTEREDSPVRERASAPRGDDAGACYAALDRAGVGFSRLAGTKAAGVDWPIVLTGPIGGVRIQGASADAPTNYLDCRLARALLDWAPQLKAAGVVSLQHYSMFRQGAVVAGAGTVSGHAHGFAIDVASFTLQDGRRLRVLEDWTERTRGADPCASYPDSAAGATMRELVCDAAEQSLFHLVLTPHYNDAHANHVHLEVAESGTPFVR